MSTIRTTVEHNGATYSAEHVIVESTFLGREDHGFLTFYLNYKGGDIGGSVGGFALDGKPAEPGGRRPPTAQGLALVDEVIRVAGVESWEKLVGIRILAVFKGEGMAWGKVCIGFANPDTGKVLILSEFLDSLRGSDDS